MAKPRDVRLGDLWKESDPRFAGVAPHRIVVSVDDSRVVLVHLEGPLAGRKYVTVKRGRFNGGASGYGLVLRPTRRRPDAGAATPVKDSVQELRE